MKRRSLASIVDPMDRDRERQRCVSRRAAVLGGAKLALMAGLAGRMYYLQVVERDRFAKLADENRINVRPLAPPRGEILDRYGVPVAHNRSTYRVVLVAEQAEDVDATLDKLAQIVELPDRQREDIHIALRHRPSFVPVTVRADLSWDEVSRVEVNAPQLPGIAIEEGLQRHYPFGDVMVHPVGYVAAPAKDDLTGEPVLGLPGVRVGKSGVEQAYESQLRGEAGSRHVEVNAVGRVVREVERDPGTPGQDVTLTLDSGLQAYMRRRIADHRSAVAVTMDIEDGAIYGLAGQPSFDPNQFVSGVGSNDWEKLRQAEGSPLVNKAVRGQYAPGSTFKMVTALAALKHGAIDSETTFGCDGFIDYGNHRYHCWRRGGHGPMALQDAIRESCDVFFYEVAKRLSIDQIADMAKRLGLGQRTGVELPVEKPGLVPTKAWKRDAKNRSWQGGETLIAAIGQGYMLATPLQLAVMTARLANGGHSVSPHLVSRVGDGAAALGGAKPRAEGRDLGLDQTALRRVIDAMTSVTMDPRGTAYGARIQADGRHMAGKTGTSQVRRITEEEREEGLDERVRWNLRPHALFVGYAPLEAPRYACAVVVEHGGSGSRTAAPVCRDVLLETQRRAPAGSVLTDSLVKRGGTP